MSVIPGLVTTIIPVYNRPGLLEDAVASVVAQTYPSIEIIIVDDGSTDETPDVCDRLAHRHAAISVLHLPHQGRIGLVREAGRRAARGEYIQYLDSDDLLLPEKFARLVRGLLEHPECDLAYCYTRRYRQGDAPLDVPAELTAETFTRMLPDFLGRRFWYTSTPLYRRALCDKAGAWSDLLFWEDIEYDIRIATHDPRLYHCREYLTDCRDHDLMRASGGDTVTDSTQMRDAARAARMIHGHVSAYGMTASDADMRLFLDDLRVIHRRCQRLGLDAEAATCAEILAEAYGAYDGDSLVTPDALIEAETRVLHARPGQMMPVPLRLTNQSPIAFRSGEFAVELRAHLSSSDGTSVPNDVSHVVLDDALWPRQQRRVDLPLQAPDRPGTYAVGVDLLWESSVTSYLADPGAAIVLEVGADARDDRWWLKVAGRNRATIESLSDSVGGVRVLVSTLTTTTPWHIQLNQSGVPLEGGVTHEFVFRARADRPRTIAAAVSLSPPLSGAILYQTVTLGTTWNTFVLAFDTTHRVSDARIHFDLGGSDIAVAVAEVAVRRAVAVDPSAQRPAG